MEMTHLVRWQPFDEFARMRERMDRMLGGFGPLVESGEAGLAADWAPSVDIFEEDDHISVRAELPGMTEKDVSITVEDGQLILRGEKRREGKKEKENGHYRRVESYYGSFYRSFPLPRDIDEDKIDAHMKDGVLHVTLPKIEGAKPKQIRVNTT
jgi:HSP20 family protein